MRFTRPHLAPLCLGFHPAGFPGNMLNLMDELSMYIRLFYFINSDKE